MAHAGGGVGEALPRCDLAPHCREFELETDKKIFYLFYLFPSYFFHDCLPQVLTWGARYGHHATVPVPEGGVTWGFTAASYARGGLFTVKPEVCPTPYRARATA